MRQRSAPFPVDLSRVLLLLLGLSTLTGWGMYLLASRSAAETEGQLRGQVASLQQIHLDLLSERQRTNTATGDLNRLQAQVEKLRQDADLLTQARDLAQAELVTAATGMRDLVSQLKSDVSATGSLSASTLDGQHLVTMTAQKALTRLGYGRLTADGVVGPGTRQAIEAFQRANNLHITGELDAPTLQRLTPSKLASP